MIQTVAPRSIKPVGWVVIAIYFLNVGEFSPDARSILLTGLLIGWAAIAIGTHMHEA